MPNIKLNQQQQKKKLEILYSILDRTSYLSYFS